MNYRRIAQHIATTFSSFDPKSKKIEEIKEDIAHALKAISSSPELVMKFREFIQRFHNYSFQNMILIFTQYPHAVQVAGYKTWQKLGRHVKKGERAIRIFAPRIKVIKETLETTGEEVKKRLLKGFKLVSTFDYHQTEGDEIEIPPFGMIEGDNPKALLGKLKSLAHAIGLTVVEKTLGFHTAGATNGKVIWLNRLTPVEGRVMTLLHELSHVILDHSGNRADLSTQIKEQEAEYTAFLSALLLGVTPKGSYEYIQGWQGDTDLDIESIQLAIKAADYIARMIRFNHEEPAELYEAV